MQRSINYNFLILHILSPLFIILGLSGYLLPEKYILFSSNPFYRLIHLNAGMIGYIVLFTSSNTLIRTYNIILGLALVYQAAASFLKIFPSSHFQYTLADDILNTDIGLILILIGLLGNRIKNKREISLP